MPRFSLTARAFVFSFLPVCLVLGASFLALSAAIHQRIKQELRQSLEDSDALLNRASGEYARRTTGLLAKLTDSAGLKAAVGLLVEVHGDPSAMKQVRGTIEMQLRELQSASTYDLVAVSDLRGQTIAAVVSPSPQEPTSLAALPLHAGLEEIQHVLYQLQTVPINIEGDTAALLTLGTRFELEGLPLGGQAVLLHGDKVDRSTLPSKWSASIERQIRNRCAKPDAGCEVSVAGETFVVSQLGTAKLGDGYRLLGFRSLDGRLREFNSGFIRILVEVGAAGILLALLSTLITSYSVSQPLRGLVAQLKRSMPAGQMPEHLSVGNGVHELDSLANAFNRVAEAERRSRRELEIAKDAAESANRLKTQFLTNVSHELRTPMNGVLGMTDLLLGTTLNADQQEYAGVVRESAQSLLLLIDNILDFSQLETGRLRFAMAPFDLYDLVSEVTAELRAQVARKVVQVEMLYPPSAPRAFVGDSNRIQQILMHLGGNAIKFTEKGHIRIHLACTFQTDEDALVKLAVEDTGIGIAPEMRELIFQKFTQGDGSLTRRRGGTGLGLAIAKEMVELMGGEIGYESSLGAGSTFWFVIPLAIGKPGFEPDAEFAGAFGKQS